MKFTVTTTSKKALFVLFTLVLSLPLAAVTANDPFAKIASQLGSAATTGNTNTFSQVTSQVATAASKMDRLPTNLNLPDDPFWKEDAEEANANKNNFKEPVDALNFADVTYVGAHNAHVYPRFFGTVRQQDQTLIGMLSYGVRGLMIDAYDWNLSGPSAMRGPEGATVCLSHGQPGAIAFSQKGHNSYQSLQYELRRIFEWLKYNPQAVVTIAIENYASAEKIQQEIAKVISAAKFDPVLTTSNWPQANSGANQTWPTLGWMRQNNKRLVIFTQWGDNTGYTWRQYSHCIENQYSTTNENELWKERSESEKISKLYTASTDPRKIVIINNFEGLAVTRPTSDTKNQVSYTTVERIANLCKSKGFAHGRPLNGYYADRIVDSCNDLTENKQLNVFSYVNVMNDKAAAAKTKMDPKK